MENGIELRQNNAPARDIGVITAEINNIKAQVSALALMYAVEIGRRLYEAKAALPYGQWGEWLKNEVNFSQSTANNMMKLFDEYGASQITLFGASVDSQSFAKLPYTKALALLAVPSDEREEFAEEVHAEDLSVKELKEAIAERDKAREIAEMQKKLKDEIFEKLKAAEDAAYEANVRADEAESFKGLYDETNKLLEKEKENAAALQEKLKAAEKDPKIPPAKLKAIRAEAEAAATKAAKAEGQKELEELKKKVENAEAEAIKARLAEKAARESLEEAQKKLKTANPDVAAFKALFDDVQRSAARLREMIQSISRDDVETGSKLAAALHAFGNTL